MLMYGAAATKPMQPVRAISPNAILGMAASDIKAPVDIRLKLRYKDICFVRSFVCIFIGFFNSLVVLDSMMSFHKLN